MLGSNQRPLPCESEACSFVTVCHYPISAFLSLMTQCLRRGRSLSFAPVVVKLSSDRRWPHASPVSGVAAWVGGLLFIPALSLALGTLDWSDKLFQGVCLTLCYAVVTPPRHSISTSMIGFE